MSSELPIHVSGDVKWDVSPFGEMELISVATGARVVLVRFTPPAAEKVLLDGIDQWDKARRITQERSEAFHKTQGGKTE